MKLDETFVVLQSLLALTWGLTPTVSIAQIVPDSSLPVNSIVAPDGNVFTIDGGTAAGTNLFHSFSDFSLPTSSEAFFNNALSIDNIITRVTGGNISNIDGLIRANGTANLFLLNPNGIVFGPNARLDIGGSFLGSTAESVLFEDGSVFSATVEANGSSPLLTVNVPVGLQMGSNPGAITVNGSGHNLTIDPFAPLERNDTPSGFQVAPGNTLALLGRSLTLNGGILTAESGRIELGAVDGNSQTVGVAATETGFALDYSQVQQFGEIQLRERALVDASGTGGGDLRVRGRNLSLRDNSAIVHDNTGAQPMGSIDIQTSESVELINDQSNITGNIIFSDVLETGRGGNISISTPRLTMQGNSNTIRALTFGDADGGDIDIDAPDLSLIAGDRNISIIVSRTLGRGNGGNVNIETGRLLLEGSSIINNANGGTGSAGRVTIQASESIEISGSSEMSGQAFIGSSAVSAVGNAGEITINTPRLAVRNGATISSSTFGAGTAGSITVNASESILVEGDGFNPITNSFEPTQIRSAGILLPEFVRQSRGLPDTVTGNAGNIILNTPSLQVSDGATVSVQHDSAGNAGNLQVNANEILLDGEGSLTASTVSGEGGNIELQVGDSLQLRNGSEIDAESFGVGNGGNITLNSDTIALLENSRITANAFQGTGGNIQITTQGLFVSGDSRISASSQFGIDGVVSITNPEVDPSSGLVNFSQEVVDPKEQVVAGCQWTADSSFVATGRGGVPANPNRPLSSSRTWSDVRDLSEFRGETVESASVRVETPERLVEATGWVVNEDGTVELIATANHPKSGNLAASGCNPVRDNDRSSTQTTP
ncbi:MAG: filamentous hemagglutinin N-terminal domain-containing protein [Geitlerinemataceae cyanobacterium]